MAYELYKSKEEINHIYVIIDLQSYRAKFYHSF